MAELPASGQLPDDLGTTRLGPEPSGDAPLDRPADQRLGGNRQVAMKSPDHRQRERPLAGEHFVDRLICPIIGTRSFGPRLDCSMRNLIASMGSGNSIGRRFLSKRSPSGVPGRADIKDSISFNAARWSAFVRIGLISMDALLDLLCVDPIVLRVRSDESDVNQVTS